MSDHMINSYDSDSAYNIVNYGDESTSIVSETVQLGTPIETSWIAPMGALSGTVNSIKGFETASIAYAGGQKPYWFLNDKTNKVVVFPSFILRSSDLTDACSPETELSEVRTDYQFIQSYKKLGKFAKYPENWDSYGAKIIDKDCIVTSINIIKQLIGQKPSMAFEMPTPFVAPLSTGGIQIEWEHDKRYLEIAINPNPLSVDFFITDQTKGGVLSLEGKLNPMTFLNELISWFVMGKTEELPLLSREDAYEEWAL